jgi:hypothetical protein
MRALRSLAAAAALVSVAAACTTYGGRPVTVKLTSTPAGATCYVVPAVEWIERGSEKLLADPAALQMHVVPGRVTPCEVELPMARMVYVARHGDVAGWLLFTPSGGACLDLTLSVPGPPVPAPEPPPEPAGR